MINDHSITIYPVLLKIVEKSSSLSHHLQDPPSRVMILLVTFEMFGEITDPFTEKGNLNLW